MPAATHNRDLASSDGVQSHRIDCQVEPHPGRDSKQSRLPQGHRVEGFGGQLKDFLLGIELGLRIQGNRVKRGILGQEGVSAGAINAARRRIQEPLHPSLSTQSRQPDRGVAIHLQGPGRVKFAGWIIAERRHVQDRPNFLEQARFERSDVPSDYL